MRRWAARTVLSLLLPDEDMMFPNKTNDVYFGDGIGLLWQNQYQKQKIQLPCTPSDSNSTMSLENMGTLLGIVGLVN
jgi:hypothetical protein